MGVVHKLKQEVIEFVVQQKKEIDSLVIQKKQNMVLLESKSLKVTLSLKKKE